MMTSATHSFDDLPVTLKNEQLCSILGISRAAAYQLMRSKGFPTIRIGKRMIVPRDKFIIWMEQQTPPELNTETRPVKREQPKPHAITSDIQPEISLVKEFLLFLSQKEAANETRYL